MVNDGKSSSRTLNSNRMSAVNTSNNIDIFDETSDNDEGGGMTFVNTILFSINPYFCVSGLRVGSEYQAKVDNTVLPKPGKF